jgi:hypothetical protein
MLCAASDYALWRTVTARFPATRDETQHINDHLRAAPAVALVRDSGGARLWSGWWFETAFSSVTL